MTNFQFPKFEQKSVVIFITEELPLQLDRFEEMIDFVLAVTLFPKFSYYM